MNLKKLITVAVSLLLLSSITFPAYSQNLDVDQLLKSADLMKLIGATDSVNLEAQMKDPEGKTSNISDLDDFIAIGVISPDYYTMLTEFDGNQNIIQQIRNESAWIGVKSYSQTEIPKLSLQDGLSAVKTCMAKQQDPTPEEITRVVVYKTVNTSEMIYDYVFSDPQARSGICQEFLYSPSTGQCQRGMKVACHMNIENLLPKRVK